jgi:hypothetical protein
MQMNIWKVFVVASGYLAGNVPERKSLRGWFRSHLAGDFRRMATAFTA